MDRSEYNERYGKGNGSFHSNSTRQMISVTRSAIYENSLREKEQKAKIIMLMATGNIQTLEQVIDYWGNLI